ncbi:hypothetical protein C0J52_18192 [Blattella germanica]|nr:hypothetical protein C0J52_18192 [Blattella germanica]
MAEPMAGLKNGVNLYFSKSFPFQVIDQKTTQDIGRFVYNLISLTDKPDLKVESQPYRLSNSGPDSKINMSLQMKILKYVGPKEGGDIDEDEEKEGPKEETTEETAPLVRGPSIKKPDSPTASGKTLLLPSEPNTPVRISKQESKDSVQSGSSSSFQQPIEELMSVTKAPPDRLEMQDWVAFSLLSDTVFSVKDSSLLSIRLCTNLPQTDPTNIPDPYVKLYLLPERAKDSKRKTETMKDNCNPIYDETFEYVLSQGELNSRQLEVSVVTRKGWFSSQSPVMGQVS